MAKAKGNKMDCVYVGEQAKAEKKADQYRGRGYIVYVLPRINSFLDAFSGEYGVYVRKVTIKDVQKRKPAQ